MESTTDTLAEDADIDAPAVSLRGWSLSGKQGDVFTDIDLEVPIGAIAVVRGPAGSGKTSFLLSLAARMRVSDGEGRLGDIDIRKQARTVRGQVAVGHIAGLTDLEDDFTVAQHVAERQIMLQPWYKPWASKSTLREVIGLIRDTFTTAGEMIDELPPGTFSKQDAQRADFLIDDDGEVFVSELSELQKFFLEFGLASLSRPPVVVIDNIDYLRESADRARAWAGILIYQQLRRSRDPEDLLTVIVSCEDSSELDIATRSLGSRAEPSIVDLELPPHPPAHRGSKH